MKGTLIGNEAASERDVRHKSRRINGEHHAKIANGSRARFRRRKAKARAARPGPVPMAKKRTIIPSAFIIEVFNSYTLRPY